MTAIKFKNFNFLNQYSRVIKQSAANCKWNSDIILKKITKNSKLLNIQNEKKN